MKSKRKKEIPAYSFGTQVKQIGGNLLENLPEAASLLASPFQKSTATTGGEAAAQSVANVASGAALGMKVAGPIGAAVGAGVGMIGSSGQEAEMTSFTDYDEGTLGTGLIGAFGNRKLRRRRAKIKQNAYNNRATVQGTSYLQSEVYDDMIGMNASAMASGGTTASLAYVDDGELIQTPDGSISKVPERGKPTDSNLVNLPEGSRILSDKLKVPGRKETFAQLGEKMMAKKKSRYKDRFAENAAKLNEMNNNMIHDQLFAMQETVKQSKGIKPKTKQIQTFDDGGLKTYKYDYSFNDYDNLYSPGYMNFVNSLKDNDAASINWLNRINSGEFGNIGGNRFSISDIRRLATDRKKGPVHNAVLSASKAYTDTVGNVKPITAKYPNRLIATNNEMAGLGDTLTSQVDKVTTLPKSNSYAKPEPQNNRFNWESALSGVISLTPIMSNLFTSKPERVDAVYNPYATSISNTMRRRRYDINPAIEDLNRNRATSNYNASQINTNTGANLAYRLQSAVNADRAIASMRSQENNYNNQYLGDYANTMNSLGQQWVNATNMANDANAQNRATTRNIRRTGMSQLSQWAQNRELMRNQKARDMEMWPLYQRFLQAGFTEEDLRALMESNSKTARRKGGK